MSPTKEDFDDLILSLAWDCLNTSCWKNLRFLTIFPTFDHLAELYPDLKIIFTEKLLEIARKSSPPSAKWFLSLPSRLPAPKEKGSSRPPYSPCYCLDYATSKRGDIRREINWKQREGERRERKRGD